MAAFKLSDDVLGRSANRKGAHAIVDQLVQIAFRGMIAAGRVGAERSSTEERILENREAFSKPLRPIKDSCWLSVVGVFWGHTAVGYSTLARDQPFLFRLFLGADSAWFLFAGEDGSQGRVKAIIQLICLESRKRRQIWGANPNVH